MNRDKSIQPRLLVIVYQGEEVPEHMAQGFVECMLNNRIVPVPEMVQVKWYNAEDISKFMGAHAVGTSTVVEHNDPETDPIVHSLVYIGKKYEECKKNSDTFAIRLSHDISIEDYRRSTGKPCEESLLTAVEILATKTINLTKYSKCMKENNVTKDMLNVIHDTYHYHKNKYES